MWGVHVGETCGSAGSMEGWPNRMAMHSDEAGRTPPNTHTHIHQITRSTPDSFSGTFRPCSLDRPKVLLPLLNVPMLDYVMEFLVSSGVQEVRRV